MSIRFYCICGKHLKAREAMAGRRSVCPACGSPVGIPSLEPTQRGTSPAPLSQNEKAARLAARFLEPDELISRTNRDTGSFVAEETNQGHWLSGPPRRGKPGTSKRLWQRRPWNLESRWYECLRYPVRAWPVVFGLATALAAMLAWASVALAHSDFTPTVANPWSRLWWIWPLLIAAYACAFLQCVLVSGAGGETSCIRWPGGSVGLILSSLLTWIVCFLAGPIVFVIAAFLFWLHCGDPTWIDHVVLAQLTMAAGSYWLLELVAVHQGDRWLDANPARVADVIRRLGTGQTLATYVAGLVALVFVYLIAAAIEQLHNHYFLGGVYLLAATTGAMFSATFFFRLLGVWCFASRVEGG